MSFYIERNRTEDVHVKDEPGPYYATPYSLVLL